MQRQLIEDKTIKEIKETLCELVDSHRDRLEDSLYKADSGKTSISFGVEITMDEAKVKSSFTPEKIKMEHKINNKQTDLPLHPPDGGKTYTIGKGAQASA